MCAPLQQWRTWCACKAGHCHRLWQTFELERLAFSSQNKRPCCFGQRTFAVAAGWVLVNQISLHRICDMYMYYTACHIVVLAQSSSSSCIGILQRRSGGSPRQCSIMRQLVRMCQIACNALSCGLHSQVFL
jgi:hypothetical protein